MSVRGGRVRSPCPPDHEERSRRTNDAPGMIRRKFSFTSCNLPTEYVVGQPS